MMPLMDAHLLPDVLVFLNVAQSGSITKAANRLNMVQSNVTTRIKKLEEALGVTLLRRHARGVKLTSGGEAVLGMALRLDALLNDFGYAFGRGKWVRETKLRLGAIETVAAVHVPDLVARFLKRCPHVDISMQIGSSSALLKQVENDELDAAFVSRAPALPTIHQEEAFVDNLVVLVPDSIKTRSDLFEASKKGINVLVQRLGCSYTERLLDFLGEHGLRPKRIMEMGTLEGIVGFVEAGVGIATMPESFVKSMLKRKKLVLLSLPKDRAIARTFIITSSNRESPLVNDFIDQCRSRLSKM